MTPETSFLFPLDEVEQNPGAPWSVPGTEVSTEQQFNREKLLDLLSRSEFANVETRVARILQLFPETRDSDTELAIQYWKRFQPDVLAEHRPLTLDVLHELQNISTIIRCRQRIQNDLELFVGSPRSNRRRGEFQMEIHQYLSSRKKEQAQTIIYIDETGTDGQSPYSGLGGICVIDTRQYEITLRQLERWRSETAGTPTFHFADVDSARVSEYVDFANQLRKYRSGLIFAGYAVELRGSKSHKVAELILHMVADTCGYMRENGCLEGSRNILVIKESEAYFDATHLDELKKDLAEILYRRFGPQITLLDIESRPKGRDVLLEGADMIAASLRRQLTSSSSIHKDRLAEAIFNATGLGDTREPGMIHKIYR